MRTVLIRADGCWHCNVVEQVLEGIRTENHESRPYLIVDVRRELMDEMRPAMMMWTGGHRTYPALFVVARGQTVVSDLTGRDGIMSLTLEQIANRYIRSGDNQPGELEGRRPETPAELTAAIVDFLERTQ